MKNYVCEVLIEFNDRLNKAKLCKVGSIYKCTKDRYLELKKLGGLKLLKIEKRKK